MILLQNPYNNESHRATIRLQPDLRRIARVVMGFDTLSMVSPPLPPPRATQVRCIHDESNKKYQAQCWYDRTAVQLCGEKQTCARSADDPCYSIRTPGFLRTEQDGADLKTCTVQSSTVYWTVFSPSTRVAPRHVRAWFSHVMIRGVVLVRRFVFNV